MFKVTEYAALTAEKLSRKTLVYTQELEVLSLSHLYSLKTKISQCHYVMTL